MISKKITRELIEVMKTCPLTRDSDEELLYMWLRFYSGYNPDRLTAGQLLDFQRRGEIPKLSYVSRERRRIQRDFIYLRGEKYEERRAYSTKVIEHIKETA